MIVRESVSSSPSCGESRKAEFKVFIEVKFEADDQRNLLQHIVLTTLVLGSVGRRGLDEESLISLTLSPLHY